MSIDAYLRRSASRWVRVFRLLGATAGMVAFVANLTIAAEKPSSSQGIIPVEVGLGPYLDYAPWLLAHQMGFDKQQGLDLQFKLIQTVPEEAALLRSGTLDIGWSCHACGFPSYKAVPSLRTFMITNQFKGFSVIGRANAGELTMSQLEPKLGFAKAQREVIESWKGKTFVFYGAQYHGLLQSALQSVGMPLSDIKIVQFGNDAQTALAFEHGTGDYTMGDLPTETKLLLDPSHRYIDIGGNTIFGPGGLWYSTMISNSSWLGKNNATVMKLMAVWYRTMHYMAERPAEAMPIIGAAVNKISASNFATSTVTYLAQTLNLFATLQEAEAHIYRPGDNLYWEQTAQFYANANKANLPDGFKLGDMEVENEYFTEFLTKTNLVKYVNSPF